MPRLSRPPRRGSRYRHGGAPSPTCGTPRCRRAGSWWRRAPRAGQPAWLQHGRDHGVLAERAVADEGGADGVGQLLAPLAGGIEHERLRALLTGELCEVAGKDGLAGLGVGLLDDAPASGVERLKRLLGSAIEHGFHDRPGVRVGLPHDLVEPERRHAVVLELAERAASLQVAELVDVADQH